MIINQSSQNPYLVKSINTSNSLVNESTSLSANSVPTNNRTISEPNVVRKPSNNIYPNYIRKTYSSGSPSSSGSLTESFIRARASSSPAYMHNEISTRYNMISAIPMKLIQIKKSVDKVA